MSEKQRQIPASTPSLRLGDAEAMARVVGAMQTVTARSPERRRRMVADFCRLLGEEFSAPSPDPAAGLSPRKAQTLRRLLAGDSEKQIARRLEISANTIHTYVTSLYRHFDVSSRGELLALFVSPLGSASRHAADEHS